MPLLSLVLDSARTLLDDENGINWQDQRLIPKLQIAFREMVTRLDRAGIPVVLAQSTVITVPAFSTDDLNQDLSTVVGYPTDMIEPIWLRERQLGQLDEDFVPMIRVDVLPNIDKTTTLNYWAWNGQVILVRGATNSTQVQIRYKKSLTTPITVNDECVVTLSETFLSFRTAQYASMSSKNWDQYQALKDQADDALDTLLGGEVNNMQDLPARRMPYRRGRRGGRSSVGH